MKTAASDGYFVPLKYTESPVESGRPRRRISSKKPKEDINHGRIFPRASHSATELGFPRRRPKVTARRRYVGTRVFAGAATVTDLTATSCSTDPLSHDCSSRDVSDSFSPHHEGGDGKSVEKWRRRKELNESVMRICSQITELDRASSDPVEEESTVTSIASASLEWDFTDIQVKPMADVDRTMFHTPRGMYDDLIEEEDQPVETDINCPLDGQPESVDTTAEQRKSFSGVGSASICPSTSPSSAEMPQHAVKHTSPVKSEVDQLKECLKPLVRKEMQTVDAANQCGPMKDIQQDNQPSKPMAFFIQKCESHQPSFGDEGRNEENDRGMRQKESEATSKAEVDVKDEADQSDSLLFTPKCFARASAKSKKMIVTVFIHGMFVGIVFMGWAVFLLNRYLLVGVTGLGAVSNGPKPC